MRLIVIMLEEYKLLWEKRNYYRKYSSKMTCFLVSNSFTHKSITIALFVYILSYAY